MMSPAADEIRGRFKAGVVSLSEHRIWTSPASIPASMVDDLFRRPRGGRFVYGLLRRHPAPGETGNEQMRATICWRGPGTRAWPGG